MSTVTLTSPTDPDLKLDLDVHLVAPGAKFLIQCRDPDIDPEMVESMAEGIRERLGDTKFVIVAGDLDVHVF
jgi:hypothetical protein